MQRLHEVLPLIEVRPSRCEHIWHADCSALSWNSCSGQSSLCVFWWKSAVKECRWSAMGAKEGGG